jgi:hypothetical protein
MKYTYEYMHNGVKKSHEVEAIDMKDADKVLLDQIDRGVVTPDVWQNYISVSSIDLTNFNKGKQTVP